MEIKKVRTWNGFIKAIKEVRDQYGIFRRELDGSRIYERKNRILFRGQSNAKWSLETTLERKTNEVFHIYSYMLKATRGASEIESFTGTDWNVISYKDLENEINTNQSAFDVPLPSYDFLVYLRHHGFPSPLLDWTESPFIAAYFAFLSQRNENSAVYCYIPTPESGRGGPGGEPQITVKGPFVKTHKRHFAQKAWYTVATQWKYSENKHYFCPHERVFDRGAIHQDLLIKIILPCKIRQTVLEHLNDYNINHFTLFQSEDSLVKAIEMKEFDLEI